MESWREQFLRNRQSTVHVAPPRMMDGPWVSGLSFEEAAQFEVNSALLESVPLSLSFPVCNTYTRTYYFYPRDTLKYPVTDSDTIYFAGKNWECVSKWGKCPVVATEKFKCFMDQSQSVDFCSFHFHMDRLCKPCPEGCGPCPKDWTFNSAVFNTGEFPDKDGWMEKSLSEKFQGYFGIVACKETHRNGERGVHTFAARNGELVLFKCYTSWGLN